MNDLPSVGTEDALRFATLNEQCANAWKESSDAHKFRMDTGRTIRALVSERDELASRVRELTKQNEAQKDEWLSWNEKRAALEANARRYEFLRNHNPTRYAIDLGAEIIDINCKEDGQRELDRAIDCALASKEHP